ncbi:hypothetical protein POVWA2_020640 [Plasmodium ovale wallikeri]|uniref:Uncharacterized protein n=1 Tax=Plasmodium ovale wallikeri TaxID=864142 RepID=A0A1A8YRN7_PLAOA|nr:hypothetical protein POVWA1_020460 [Plasmodium ovale wallikeri]SBT34578.1 hypothetical protein POVWA2_020640 [Plasmodium ovale wallikeri]
MIIIFLIINAYLHPNFENDKEEKNTLLNIFLNNSNFESNTEGKSLSYNCSSYTLFIYKYDDKHKLYGLYNIFYNSNISNLVNIHKDKFLTCIFNNKFSDHNVCIVNKKYEHSGNYAHSGDYEHSDDYDRRLIDIFLHNSSVNYEKKSKHANEMHLISEQRKEDQRRKWKRWNVGQYIKEAILFVKTKIKYESIFKLKRNDPLLRNDIITLTNSDEHNNLYQIINILVYYRLQGYKIVLETKGREAFDINYVKKFLCNIFFYEKSLNYHIKNESSVFLKNLNWNGFCHNKGEESIFSNMCFDYNYPGNDIHLLKGLYKNILRNINFTFSRNVEEITKKKKKNEEKFKIKQISIYSKILFSDLDSEKYILKICNSSHSFKKLKFVTINYMHITYLYLTTKITLAIPYFPFLRATC